MLKKQKNRGFEVTAFVRKQAEIEGADKVIVKDIFSLTKQDLEDINKYEKFDLSKDVG